MKLIQRILKGKPTKVTSPFGMRWHPIKKKWMMHNGADYSSFGKNYEVYAIEEGTVIACGYTDEVGNFVKINFPRINIQLWFFHLLEQYMVKGQKVDENTLLGLVGSTGSSTAIHLHLGMKWISNGNFFDPELFDYQPSSNLISIDGLWGYNTTKALQLYYSLKADGIISGQIKQNANKNIYAIKWGLGGSNVIRALQKDLGLKQDGYVGTQTIMALQSKLGTKITGVIKPIDETVMELQTRLRNGSLWQNKING